MPELTDPLSLRERIIAESKPYLSPEPQEGEFIVPEFMEWTGLDQNGAYKALQQLVKDGKLTKRKGKSNGASVNVYKEVA